MPHTPLHLGLTGNIASGKSTVARQLAALGATVIDADQLAREAVAPGTEGYVAVVERFGDGVVASNGSLDRSRLRQRVFDDPVARAALNAIVHPAVSRLRAVQLAQASARGDRIVLSDIPLLFEVGLAHDFDGIILVDAPVAVRRDRLIRDRGLTAHEADAMIEAQWESAPKRKQSTWVIDNDGTPEQLQRGVASLWHTIRSLAEQRRTSAPSVP